MERRRHPSMAEVAQVAGVSHQTVSRVINGFEGVRPETKLRVEMAIKELGYRRNALARALATRSTKVIGVIAVGSFLYGPSRTLAALSEAAQTRGYSILISTIREADETAFGNAIGEFLETNTAAIIVIAARKSLSRYADQLELDVPIIMVGPRVDSSPNLPSMSVDQGEGARTAIRHLIQLGHEKIAILAGPPNWTDAAWRREEAIAECAAAGIDPTIHEGDWSAHSGYVTGIRISTLAAARRPTAIFSANDHMALGLFNAFFSTGISVPRDISVIGFDDVPESSYYSPSLTTIFQDFATLGHRVLDAAIALINDEMPDTTPVPAELRVRSSTSRA